MRTPLSTVRGQNTQLPAWVFHSTLQSNRLWGTTLALGGWLLEPVKLHPWRPEAHQLLSSAYTVLSHWLHIYSSGWLSSTTGIQILTINDKDEHGMSCNTTFLDTICRLNAFRLPLAGQARQGQVTNTPGHRNGCRAVVYFMYTRAKIAREKLGMWTWGLLGRARGEYAYIQGCY